MDMLIIIINKIQEEWLPVKKQGGFQSPYYIFIKYTIGEFDTLSHICCCQLFLLNAVEYDELGQLQSVFDTKFAIGMLDKCKKNVLSQFELIRNMPKNSSAKSSILILDTVTAPILSDMFSIQQLLEVGIKDLCRIDRVKKPEPSSIAIYYISCKYLQFLYKDFKSNQPPKDKDKEKKKSNSDDSEERSYTEDAQGQNIYMSINLLLCQQASDDVLKDISQHEEIIERLASFGQLYIPCRYTDRNIALIPFSMEGQKNLQTLRRMTKSINNKLFDQNAAGKKQQQEREQYNAKKGQRLAHNIHKQNLSCLPQIYLYEYQKFQTKDKKKIQEIQNNLRAYAKKLCQAVMGGINVGLSTVVKIVTYESKFSQKLKELFVSNYTECMQAKSKQLQQGKLQEQSSSGEGKSPIFVLESNEPEAKQVIIIIADREADNLSPLIRSFYYEPLLMDIFDIKDPPEKKIKIISPKIAPTTMEVTDKIFCQYNNMFISEVFHRINPSLQDYMAVNKAAKFHKDKVTQSKGQQFEMQQKQSAKQLKQVIKELPQYKKTIKSYNTNIEILNVMGTIAKQRKMYDEGELEHTIITGYSGDKKQAKDKKILEQILIMLQNKDVLVEDKCRLMVLAVCCLDIESSERNKLITRLSKVEGHGDIAMGLSKISSRGVKKYPLPLSFQKSGKQCYMDRHQCTLSSVVQQLLSNGHNLPKMVKSFKMEEVKALSVTKKPQVKGSLTKNKIKNTEYVISMCGGLGYNEISEIERVIRNSNQANLGVNFVTDYIFTPAKYLEQLCGLL